MKNNSTIISNKLEELITLCKVEGEPHVASILCSIQGARFSGHIQVLHTNVHKCTTEVLMPLLAAAAENAKAIKN